MLFKQKRPRPLRPGCRAEAGGESPPLASVTVTCYTQHWRHLARGAWSLPPSSKETSHPQQSAPAPPPWIYSCLSGSPYLELFPRDGTVQRVALGRLLLLVWSGTRRPQGWFLLHAHVLVSSPLLQVKATWAVCTSGCCEQCCYGHCCPSFCSNNCFSSSGVEVLGDEVIFCLTSPKNCPTISAHARVSFKFPRWV